jgi:transposase
MVNGWPIAHQVWEGNRLDHSTVLEAVEDLRRRFAFGRVVFVGDRGMVTEDTLAGLSRDGQGYLVGIKRRRNTQFDEYVRLVKEKKWQDCPLGITAGEKKDPPRTRVQEVASGEKGLRVFVIDSQERREYEEAMRLRSMEKTREKLAAVQQRVARGELVEAAKIGAAAQRALSLHHGHRYYTWRLRQGVFEFEPNANLLREKRLEGKYVIATTEKDLDALEAVQIYKDLSEVERGFRHLKDVLALRPIWHRIAPRVRGLIFVAALALLLERLLERRLKEAGVDLSAPEALQSLATIRLAYVQCDDS